VKFWRNEKGHGVITVPDVAPWDVWCHFSAISGRDFRALSPGQPVEVEFVRFDQESFKYIARRVTPQGKS
jgi:cold shock CspA family protein